jgi:hypothetical protein
MSVRKQRGWQVYLLVEFIATAGLVRFVLEHGGGWFDAVCAIALLHVMIPHRAVYINEATDD